MIDRIAEVAGRDVSRETFERLTEFVALLVTENAKQNLIGASTVAGIWERHILDSVQLLRLSPGEGRWLDIGSGAGIPGVVLAILGATPMTLVEPRRLRAEFLSLCIERLALDRTDVVCAKVDKFSGKADIITARAVASVDRIFAMAAHVATPRTRWILPKGRSGAKELAEAQTTWQGSFRIEPSVTAGDAVIVVGSGVSRRQKGRT